MKLSGGTFASRGLRSVPRASTRLSEKLRRKSSRSVLGRRDYFGTKSSIPVWRVAEILEWVESGEYKALMSAPGPPRLARPMAGAAKRVRAKGRA